LDDHDLDHDKHKIKNDHSPAQRGGLDQPSATQYVAQGV